MFKLESGEDNNYYVNSIKSTPGDREAGRIDYQDGRLGFIG
jgi:hypothetical protein